MDGVEITYKEGLSRYEMQKPSVELLMKDDELEEIMINGPNIPVFVYHRKHGMTETNLVMSEEKIEKWIKELAEKAGEYIGKDKPFLDARLPDGSRFNATIPPSTPQGATITIRKFRQNPLSIISLMKQSTLTSDLAAYLWEMVCGERNYPLNILVVGGTGSGKTTTLNILTSFIPLDERIITIEDTPELNFFGRKNVINMETKSTGRKQEVTMNDLLINALRMRPDRIIMGEVRGEEAESLFNAMNVGHSAMGTLHANSPGECLSRLTNPPMSVPKEMLQLMDLIIVEKKIRSKDGLKRRISSVVEVVKSEVGVSFSEMFYYDAKTDSTVKTNVPSQKIEEIAKLSGVTKAKLMDKMEDKKYLLEELLNDGVENFKEVQDTILEYYEKEERT